MPFSPSRTNKKGTPFWAVVFDPSTIRKEIEQEESLGEPLITDLGSTSGEHENNNIDALLDIINRELGTFSLKQIKICCFIFGVLLGFFAQISFVRKWVLATTIPLIQIICRGEESNSSNTSTSRVCLIGTTRIWDALISFTLFFGATCFLVIVVRHLLKKIVHTRESVMERVIFYFMSQFSFGFLIAVNVGLLFQAASVSGTQPSKWSDTNMITVFLTDSILFCLLAICLIFTLREETITIATTTTATRETSSEPVLLV